MKAKISFAYKDENTAKIIAKLLQLDNEIAPKNLEIKTSNKDKEVITYLHHESLNTFFATMDDLIFSTKLIEDVLEIDQN